MNARSVSMCSRRLCPVATHRSRHAKNAAASASKKAYHYSPPPAVAPVAAAAAVPQAAEAATRQRAAAGMRCLRISVRRCLIADEST